MATTPYRHQPLDVPPLHPDHCYQELQQIGQAVNPSEYKINVM